MSLSLLYNFGENNNHCCPCNSVAENTIENIYHTGDTKMVHINEKNETKVILLPFCVSVHA